MRQMLKALLATASLLVPGIAVADSLVLNTQVQLGDALSNLNVTVCCTIDELTASSIAVGNHVAASAAHQGMAFTSTQTMAGNAQANLGINAYGLDAPAANVIAIGNTAAAEVCCGLLTTNTTQTTAAGTNITAYGTANVEEIWGPASFNALAVANTAGYSAWHGAIVGTTHQYNAGDVDATFRLNTGFTWGTDVIATALANNLTVEGVASGAFPHVYQINRGSVHSLALLNGHWAYDPTVMATSAGNNITVENEGLHSWTVANQTNSGTVEAESYINLGWGWNGTAVVAAYGVGNSTLLSEVGSAAALATGQTNSSNVTAVAGLNSGGVGDDAMVSAMAVGNAVTGTVCSDCGQYGIEAYNSQTNSGTIRASTYINSHAAGGIYGSATAIGNSATYHAGSPNN